MAQKNADGIMAFETALAKVSQGVTDRRDPEKIYHLMPVETLEKDFPADQFVIFEDAVGSPRVSERISSKLQPYAVAKR